MSFLRGFEQVRPRRDLIAGLTVWAVLIPESFAYATIAGVSPVVGLYAAAPALVLYAVLGSSRHLVVASTAASAALSAAAVAELTTGGPQNFAAFTAMLALLTGAFAILAGLFRMGFVANLISAAVVKGGLFFANADAVRQSIRTFTTRSGVRAVIVDAEAIAFIDVTAARMLAQRADELESSGVRLVIAREIGQVRDFLPLAADNERLRTVYPTVQAAVDDLGEGG